MLYAKRDKYDKSNQTVNGAGIPADYYRAKSTAVYTDGGRAINGDERQALLIEFIADNFHTEGVTGYTTPLDHPILMATDGYFDIYGLRLEKGRAFNKDEYDSDNADMPIIMGYGFINDYDIGDTYMDKFTIVGFLSDEQYIPELSGRISKGFSVNYNIYTPIKSREWLKENGVSYPTDLIYSENKSELDAINQKAEELGLYAYNFLSADEAEQILINTTSTLNIPLVLITLLITAMSLLCLVQSMLEFVRKNIVELLIHMICGAKLSNIILRVGAGTVLTAFISAAAASLAFRSASTAAVLFITAAAVTVIAVLPIAISLKLKPPIVAVKEEK